MSVDTQAVMTVINDTIFARASGAGKAGVAVYRLSGPQSHRIASELIGKQINYREAKLAAIRDPADGSLIDRGLAILFKGPHSYTGEDVCELHLHGSRAVETSLFETLAAAGAWPAEAGEFTLRALKNNKLDLAQAEALADLIDAETTLQRKQALGQLEGRLSTLAEGWKNRLIAVMAPLEADIDFPDEADIPAAIAARAGPAIAGLKKELTLFLVDSRRARMIREGVSIAVIGPPNAGKSSLVNILAGSEIAIVSDVAGTTRDVIEARLDFSGVIATIADTAGLRDAAGDAIEEEGMRRARRRAEEADIRIAVLDPTSAFVSRETLALLRTGDFLVWTRADLDPVIPDQSLMEGVKAFVLSTKTGLGLEPLVSALSVTATAHNENDGPGLTRLRHVIAVEAAIDALERAEQNIASAPELAAEDSRLAARALGSITGAVGVEEVLGEIFSSFCIGK